MPLKIAMVLVACFCSALAVGQNIYSWTDAEGNVHFGSKPPNLDQVEVVDEIDNKAILQSKNLINQERQATANDFSGHYIGTRLGQTVHWVFSQKGYFVESVAYKQEGYAVKNMRSYAGTWRFNKNYISFTPTFTDHGSNFIVPPVNAAILSIAGDKMKVVIGDEEVTFVRQHGGGRVAFPESMR